MRSTDQGQQVPPRGVAGESDAHRTASRYVACYAYFALVLFGCYVNFWAWERVVKTMILAWFRGSMATEAFYAFSMVVVGCVLFAVAMLAEHQLRTSVPKGRLLATFKRLALRLTAGVLAAVLFVTFIDVLFVR